MSCTSLCRSYSMSIHELNIYDIKHDWKQKSHVTLHQVVKHVQQI